jgi:hypothetical protein
MRNLTQFAVSMVLLASQVHIPALGSVTASAASQDNVVGPQYEVSLNTKSASAVTITANRPDYDTQVLAPIRAAQAAAAKQAAAPVHRVYVWTKAVLPAGSHEDWMREAGIAESDFGYVNYIVDHESGWGVTKYSYSGSGSYGLGQATPASKMAVFGADYMTNPVTQLKWANAYAVSRYGSWSGAYAYWSTYRHW